MTAYYTGMRTGEVLALTWDDIDLDNRIIRVNKTVYSKIKDNQGRWYFGTTKTNASMREIYICDTLYKIFVEYKKQQKANRNLLKKKYCNYYIEEMKTKYGKIIEYKIVKCTNKKKINQQIELVFTKKNGEYNGTDIIKYPFKIIHNELGIRQCRFYDLRGNFATNTLNNGIEIKDVSKALGHSRIETTLNYYVYSNNVHSEKVVTTFDKVTTLNKFSVHKIFK